MATRVSLDEFKRQLQYGVEYPKRSIKELSVRLGYQIPKEFWTECLISPARYGVVKEEAINEDSIIIDEDEFIVDIEDIDEMLTVIEVTHIENDQSALTTIAYGSDTRATIERLMKSWSPYNTKQAHLLN